MKNQILDVPQVSQEENDVLISEFTETEVKDAVFQMEHNKAPGPDGFPVEFYQVLWNLGSVWESSAPQKNTQTGQPAPLHSRKY